MGFSGSREVGFRKALIISSVLFGLMHLNVSQFFYATVMGFLIGAVMYSSRSIIPAIIVHFTNNFINIYLAYSRQSGLYGKNFYENITRYIAQDNPALTFIAITNILVLFLFIISSLLLTLYKESKILEVASVQKKINEDIKNNLKLDTDALTDDEVEAINSVLKNQTKPLMPDMSNINGVFNTIVPVSKLDKIKYSILDNLFLYASLFFGGLITIFTFIWGLV